MMLKSTWLGDNLCSCAVEQDVSLFLPAARSEVQGVPVMVVCLPAKTLTLADHPDLISQ